MANIYTKPVQSQFVPTYQPINLDAINVAAQAMQKRQDENFAISDRLTEKMRQMSKQVMEEDQPLFRSKVEGIRSQLDKLAADGDLSDAGRQIRGLANKFAEEATYGDIGKAMQNFSRVQEKFTEIEEADLTGEQKDALKRNVIEGYQGVGKGGLDLSSVSDDVDVNAKISDLLDDVDPQELVRETPWQYDERTGFYQKGNIKTKTVPPDLVRNIVEQGLKGDPATMAALRQRAKIATVGQDEFYTESPDGEAVPTTRNQKIEELVNQQINNAVSLGQQQYVQNDVSITSDTRNAPSGVTPGGFDVSVTKRGITNVKDTMVTSFEDALQDIQTKNQAGNRMEAKELSGSLEMALDSFVMESQANENMTNVSHEDVTFMKQMANELAASRERVGKKGGDLGSATLSTAEGAAGRASTPGMNVSVRRDLEERVGEEKVKKYNRLRSQFDDWIEKGGGWTDTEIAFDNASRVGNAAHERAQDAISRAGANNFKVYGQQDEDSREFLNQGIDDENSVFDTFQFEAVVPGNKWAPTMLSGTVMTPDGERKKVRLVEKRSPATMATDRDITDSVLEQLGERGDAIKERRRVEHITPKGTLENYAGEIPGHIKPADVSFAGLRYKDGGFQAYFGSEDSPKAYTEGHFIKNIYSNGQGRNARVILEEMNTNGALTPKQVGFILDGSLMQPEGEEEKEMASQIERILAEKFTDPYTFRDKLQAVKAASRTR